MTEDTLQRILTDFKEQFQDELPGVAEHRPFVQHFTIPLVPGQNPPSVPPRRLSPVELAEARKQVEMLLAKGLISASHSPYGAPVVFASKPDGSLRMCIDYRALNNITIKNKFPIPRIDDLIDQLQGATIFSALDLTSGYWQIPMYKEDISKTAFRTPDGLYEWNVLPFGLTNAPAAFQATMNAMLKPYIGKFALVYLDDILIYSKTPAEHEEHLRAVLTLLKQNKFYCKLKKCAFNKAEVKYLGHIVGRDGVKVDPDKCKAILNWPVPKSHADVRSFLGLATYFRKFVKGFSMRTAPLTNSLKGQVATKRRKGVPAVNNEPFEWSKECQAAFDDIKQALTSAPVLRLPDHSKPFTVVCDASLQGVGAVLLQEGQAVAYESHKLTDAERNYTTSDQELLAVVRALEVWRVYLEGPEFTVVTDHNPNVFFHTKKDLSRRQARWAELMSRYHFTWKYIPGKTNIADPLSRLQRLDASAPLALISLHRLRSVFLRATTRQRTRAEAPVPVVVTPATSEEVETRNDVSALVDVASDLTELQQQIRAGYAMDPFYSGPHSQANTESMDLQLGDDGLWYKGERIAVPVGVRAAVTHMAHDAWGGHLGHTKTVHAIERFYWWPGLRDWILDWVQTCEHCQRNKSHRNKSQGLLQPLPIPDRRFGSISMDFIVGLPPSPGAVKNDSVFVIVDRLTKLVEFIPCKTTLDAPDCMDLLMKHWVRHHGLPDSIVSDRDTRFTSKFWEEFLRLYNVTAKRSTAFHPQSDGQTERMNRTLEEMLRHVVTPTMDNWEKMLPSVQFAYNNSVHASTGKTPFMAAYGFEPVTPLTPAVPLPSVKHPYLRDVAEGMKTITAEVQAALLKAQQRQASYANQFRKERVFAVGDRVLLSTENLRLKGPKNSKMQARKLLPKFIGPFKIVRRCGDVAYELELPASLRIHDVFHVSLLQKWYPHSRHGAPPPVVLLDDGSLEYEVQKIIDIDLNPQGKPKRMLVRWLGYGHEHDTWEQARHITNCQDLVDEFWRDRRARTET
jgi:hypothetical protein